MAFDKVSYDREYVKRFYKRVSVYIAKDKDSTLKALAKSENMSVNQLIITALNKVYDIDFSQV